MANEEHLEILRKGVDVWNKWRDENPDITPNLSNANLLGAYLQGANLKRTDLQRANLQGANLIEAKLDYSWVLDIYRYDGIKYLMCNLKEKIIAPAEAKAMEYDRRRQLI